MNISVYFESVFFHRDNNGHLLIGQNVLVAGNVSHIVVDLSYRNLGEPAFQTSLTFSLPHIFFNPIISSRNVNVSNYTN